MIFECRMCGLPQEVPVPEPVPEQIATPGQIALTHHVSAMYDALFACRGGYEAGAVVAVMLALDEVPFYARCEERVAEREHVAERDARLRPAIERLVAAVASRHMHWLGRTVPTPEAST